MKVADERVRELTVFYDGSCGMCRALKVWLERKADVRTVRLYALQSLEAREVFPDLDAYRPEEQLIAVDNWENVYQGADAWIMCMASIRKYGRLAARVAKPELRPLARMLCQFIATNRFRISQVLCVRGDEDFAREVRRVVKEEWELRPFCQCER